MSEHVPSDDNEVDIDSGNNYEHEDEDVPG